MSHRLWCLHLAGFMFKKGGHEIPPKKVVYSGKVVMEKKTQIILRKKSKALLLGKPPQGDNTEESQQKLPNTLVLLSSLSCSLLYSIQNQFLFVQFAQRRTRDPILTCAAGRQEPLQ